MTTDAQPTSRLRLTAPPSQAAWTAWYAHWVTCSPCKHALDGVPMGEELREGAVAYCRDGLRLLARWRYEDTADQVTSYLLSQAA